MRWQAMSTCSASHETADILTLPRTLYAVRVSGDMGTWVRKLSQPPILHNKTPHRRGYPVNVPSPRGDDITYCADAAYRATQGEADEGRPYRCEAVKCGLGPQDAQAAEHQSTRGWDLSYPSAPESFQGIGIPLKTLHASGPRVTAVISQALENAESGPLPADPAG